MHPSSDLRPPGKSIIHSHTTTFTATSVVNYFYKDKPCCCDDGCGTVESSPNTFDTVA